MPRTGLDPFSPEQRSAVMRRVPSKGSSAELKVRKALTALGVRYRLHRKDLPGSPDIVMPGRRLALFVHGCFWHGHDCRRGARPPTANADYWSAKIARNRLRDVRVQDELRAQGWRAEVVWECELKDGEALGERLRKIVAQPPNPPIPAKAGTQSQRVENSAVEDRALEGKDNPSGSPPSRG